MDPSVPFCPSSDSRLLSENYPIMAATVSDALGEDVARDYVLNVLKAQKDKPPQFFLHVEPKTYLHIKDTIEKQSVDAVTKKKWIESLTVVNSNIRWNWQQDYFESFFDPKTGRPILREVEGYKRHKDSFDALTSSVQKVCGINRGELLRNKENKAGHSGGNIEAINGLCLLGDDHFEGTEWDDYAKEVCGSLKSAVKVPSAFLEVGHVDEMFKTLKDPSQKAPCDFALSFASPKRGFELLTKNSDEQTLDFSSLSELDVLGRMVGTNYEVLCKKFYKKRKNQDPMLNRKSNEGISKLIHEILIKSAFAQDVNNKRIKSFIDSLNNAGLNISDEDRQKITQNKISLKNFVKSVLDSNGVLHGNPDVEQLASCYSMTNGQLLKTIQSDPLNRDFNESIEKTIAEFKVQILEKIKGLYPQCNPKVVDFPSIFTRKKYLVEKAEGHFVRSTRGESYFPNPTNGEIVEDTYIMPELVSPVFRRDIEQSVKSLGLRVSYVDTYQAHANKGNLHCSTHVIRYCRPRLGEK